ncbi:MAG TPA: TetR/AcrR family transcriptional regulator [Pseudonocardiaceae bacterium]|jgi:AcrR family transcriptional regulator|nr:TetR/AcrR family transcriptional regulator [Pseudonocardiaceae bacterium]
MPYRRTPAVEAKLAASRESIRRAAIALLAEQGYAGCSIAAVAARAGVATGTVYKHFPGKSDLLTEVFRYCASHEVAVATEAAGQSGGPPDWRLVAYVETFANRALKSPRLAYALLIEPVDPAIEAERLIYRRAHRDVIAEIIAEGVRTGALPPQNPIHSASAAVGALSEGLVTPLATGIPESDTVASLVQFILRAIGGSNATNA